MAAAKTERLLNLTICLLSMRHYVSKADIRRYVSGYDGQSDQAFDRMFERDKEELRQLGVPIESGSNDHYFDDEPGYRIRPSNFELPPIELDADEAAVLGVAARAWREASVAGASGSAMTKLRSAGVEFDPDRLPALEPAVATREPGFAVFYDAVLERFPVTFDYRSRGRRTVEPWRFTSSKGRWYVLGRDRDREEPRMFKLSRIVGMPIQAGPAGSFEVPTDVDLAELSKGLEPQAPTRELVVAVRADRAPALRRRGTAPAADDQRAVRCPAGFDAVVVAYESTSMVVAELAAYASDVVVLDPPEVRDALLDHLQRLVTQPPAGRPEDSATPGKGSAS
ncbi:helix-turn-helix transcriptional regulator [Microlunatus sp. Y2014]|uniref:helix-turn-helix transcriptional regulator n=1 Tax=Microlunatus sp. Y2014 TaxID=3418488 RepID=UPI003DA77B84